MYKNLIICFVLMCFFASCKKAYIGSKDKEVADVASSFAYNYFSVNIVEARKYVTSDSETWLRLFASNIVSDDINMINNSEDGVSVEITDVKYLSDTTAIVRCKVNNYLNNEDLCSRHYIADEGNFSLHLVKANNKWLVRMEGLLQNERQSLD